MSSLSDELAEIDGSNKGITYNETPIISSNKITQRIKIGDVVKFKSGSPEMTVDNVYGDKCSLIYFIGSFFNLAEDVPIQCLELVRS